MNSSTISPAYIFPNLCPSLNYVHPLFAHCPLGIGLEWSHQVFLIPLWSFIFYLHSISPLFWYFFGLLSGYARIHPPFNKHLLQPHSVLHLQFLFLCRFLKIFTVNNWSKFTPKTFSLWDVAVKDRRQWYTLRLIIIK